MTAADMGLYYEPLSAQAFLIRSVANQFAGISRLSDDFLNTTGGIISHGPQVEGQALFRAGSTYYLWGSHLTGWAPNPAVLSVAALSNAGLNTTWTPLGNPSGDATTFDSQSTFVLPYSHPDGHVTYIYMGDRWNEAGPGGLLNATYVWLPLLQASNGSWSMPWRDSWRLGDF